MHDWTKGLYTLRHHWKGCGAVVVGGSILLLLLWQQGQQNFAIAGVSGSGSSGVQAGFDALVKGNVRKANNAFHQATIDDPTDTTAGFYHAVTRIVTKAIDTPRLRKLARRSGVSLNGNARDVCRLDFSFPKDIPLGAPRTTKILEALRDVLVPEIDAALATLNGLPTSIQVPFYPEDLPTCLPMVTERLILEIDQGDVQVLIAALQAIRALSEALAAYDLDISLRALEKQSLQGILAAEPKLLTLVSRARLSPAQTFLDQALANARQAIRSVLEETDSQADDVLVITPGDLSDARRIWETLYLVRQSLQGPVVLPTYIGLNDPERLNLSVFFSGRLKTLRPLLPAPDGSLPDPTFGGIAPDFTQHDIEKYAPW